METIDLNALPPISQNAEGNSRPLVLCFQCGSLYVNDMPIGAPLPERCRCHGPLSYVRIHVGLLRELQAYDGALHPRLYELRCHLQADGA